MNNYEPLILTVLIILIALAVAAIYSFYLINKCLDKISNHDISLMRIFARVDRVDELVDRIVICDDKLNKLSEETLKCFDKLDKDLDFNQTINITKSDQIFSILKQFVVLSRKTIRKKKYEVLREELEKLKENDNGSI